MRRHAGIVVAVVAGCAMVASARQLTAQDLGPTVEVFGGYSRRYHANGGEFDLAIMTPIVDIPARWEHRIGLVVRISSNVAESDLATITFVRDQREMVGAGVRYVVIANGGALLSPFLGATVQVVHASPHGDIVFGESGHPTKVAPNPEDSVKLYLSSTGPVFGGESGLVLRVSGSVRALLRGSLEYQAVYTNPSTHIVWGLSAGVALAI